MPHVLRNWNHSETRSPKTKTKKAERKDNMKLHEKYLITEKYQTINYEHWMGDHPIQTKWVVMFNKEDPNDFEIGTRWGSGVNVHNNYIDKHPKFKSIEDAVKWLNKRLNWKLKKR